MQRATRITLSSFGVLAGIAGLEHGIGEVLQGPVDPGGLMFLSWPETPFFSVHSGEPAMSLLPNLLLSGILSILLSLALMAWSVWGIQRRGAGWVLLLLSILLLLVGGGFGPPLLGLLLSLTALRAHQGGRPNRLVPAALRFAGRLWPLVFPLSLAAWLLLFPGLNLLNTSAGVELSEGLVYGVIASAFVLLLLALWTGLNRDRARSG